MSQVFCNRGLCRGCNNAAVAVGDVKYDTNPDTVDSTAGAIVMWARLQKPNLDVIDFKHLYFSARPGRDIKDIRNVARERDAARAHNMAKSLLVSNTRAVRPAPAELLEAAAADADHDSDE